MFTTALAEVIPSTAEPAAPWYAGIAEWAQTAFKKVGQITPVTWGVLLILTLVAIGLFALSRNKQQWNARMIAAAALCVALAFILSCIRLYRMPQGGSITAASMLPLLAFAYLYGPAPGLVAGLAYGMLQFLQDPVFLHPVQFMLDYPIAFGVLCLAGFFRKLPENVGLPVGIFVGCAARFVCTVVSGAVFFAEYAGPQNPWIYSILYNGAYMLPDTLVCVALSFIPSLRNVLRRLTGTKALAR